MRSFRLSIVALIFALTEIRLDEAAPEGLSEKSPFHQHLPDCTKPYPVIKKKTKTKGIVCPMIKDETGFLSEWAAFYEMQGFDHIIFYDNNSTSPMDELKPWLDSGFATIRRDWWRNKLPNLFKRPKQKYFDMMSVKFLAEVECKMKAVELGYEIFVSLDLDEYLMPSTNDMTVMDELVNWFNHTTRGMFSIEKFQFPPNPHLLEPINLLTIEAYQTRMPHAKKMNYYTRVSDKVALRLMGSPDYSNMTTEMLVKCCDFHGCGNSKAHKECHRLIPQERDNILGRHRKYIAGPRINHYARSLEKYMLKMRTWDTAGAHKDYDMYNYMDRLSGFQLDDSAVAWGCQLRDLLRNRTGQQNYIRPGNFWYRNPEFGKIVDDPRKRGRNGAALGIALPHALMNPYPPGETYQGAHRQYDAKIFIP